MTRLPLPRPPVELTWDEAGDLAGLLGDAFRQIAWSGRDQLEARLLRAIESLISRQLSARSRAMTGAGQ